MNFTSLFISFFLNSFIVWMKRLALPNEREPNLSKVYFDYDSVVVCLLHYSYRDCEIVFIIRRLFWFLLIKSSLLDCPPSPLPSLIYLPFQLPLHWPVTDRQIMFVGIRQYIILVYSFIYFTVLLLTWCCAIKWTDSWRTKLLPSSLCEALLRHIPQ